MHFVKGVNLSPRTWLVASGTAVELFTVTPDSHLAVHDRWPIKATEKVLQANEAALLPCDQASVLWDKWSQGVRHQQVQAFRLHLTEQLQHLPSAAQMEVSCKVTKANQLMW